MPRHALSAPEGPAGAQPAGTRYERVLDELLDGLTDGHATPRVAVLGGRDDSPAAQWLALHRPDAELVLVDHAPAESLHLRLAVRGPFDLVADESPRRGRAARLRVAFFHVRAGGYYLARRALATDGVEEGSLPTLVERLEEARRDGTPEPPVPIVVEEDHRPRRAQDIEALAAAIDQMYFEARHLVLRSKHDALAKVRETEAAELLRLRPDLGRVLCTVPPARLDVPHHVVTNDRAWADRLPDHFDAPELAVREYADVLCLPGQVALRDNLVLPETYRHNMRPRLRNKFLADWGAEAVRPPRLDHEPTDLEGAWFHLDNEHRGHFGHALTEQVAKLWGWAEAKRHHPGLRALVTPNRGRSLAGWERALVAAAGLDAGDLVMVDAPVRVERLVAATPQYSMPQYVHPSIARVWDTLGRSFSAAAADRDYPRWVFCSRKVANRPCHNAAEVEAIFAEAGWTVVYPEDLPLPEQVEMFRRADRVAGFSGSQMFHLAFVEDPADVLLICPASYTALNEVMIAAVRGHRLTMAISEPDVPQPEDSWSREAFKAGFTFDPDREGRLVRDWMAG